MAVLRVREYERIHCGAAFDPEGRVVTGPQQRELERFSESCRRTRGISAFQHGPRNSLVAQNFVGVINIGPHQVEVLPKIEGSDHQARCSLARMVAMTLDLTLHADGLSEIERADVTLLEILVRLYCEELWKAVRRGIVRRYEAREENLVVLRGRLNVPQQLRHNLVRPDRLHCTFDEFSDDNPLNRVLKTALRILLCVARRQATVKSITELLFCFQDVSDTAPSAIDWSRISTDRLSERYAPLARLARLFIVGRSPDLISGGGDGFAVLFDMNELFEEYVGRVAMRAFGRRGLQVSLQGPKRHLARSSTGARAFELRPDIVVGQHGSSHFVIDTKWKRLREDAHREAVSSADMYQMFAYANRYDVDEVVLLYPHHSDLGAWTSRRAEYELAVTIGATRTAPKRVVVSTVDLLDLSSVPAQLEALVKSPVCAAA